MNRILATRIFAAYLCLIALPLPTLAQGSSHSAAVATHPAAIAASSSSATATEALLNLPDAPTPDGGQQGTGQNQSAEPAKSQTASPSQNNGLTLQGLGFTPAQVKGNAKLQARMNKRNHMLQIHQKLGLLTLIPMVATVAVSGGAKQKRSHVPGAPLIAPSSEGVDLHVALGSLTILMYGATAYYAIAAPKIPGVKPRGAIRLHRDLAFIHVPGMVLIPILGAMALNQENKGEKVHGIASAHQAVAIATVGAYAASIVAVSWPIHWKFWERR